MRADLNLRSRYRSIMAHAGTIFYLAGFIIASPCLSLIGRPQEAHLVTAFLLPALVLAALGLFIRIAFRRDMAISLNMQEGGVIVISSWPVVCLFSAWPFMQILNLSFTASVFEAVSGWTTTGLSIVDVSRAPHLILLWRSIMQLAGGAGFAIIMLAAIVGPVGTGLSVAEGRADQLAPHVRRSARLVLRIYAGYTIGGIILLRLAGMNVFDAVNHTFTAVSTGGFSTRTESIAFWDSPSIEAVIMVLMIAGNINFLTAFFILKGKLRTAVRNSELRLFVLLIIICPLILYFLQTESIYPSLGKSLRTAFFESITALTTTGFTSTVYDRWSSFGYFLIILLMLVGGGSGSTAGGLKQFRVYLLYKSFIWRVQKSMLPPNAVVEHFVWQGDRHDSISVERIRRTADFVFFYLFFLVMGTLMLLGHGYRLKESMFELASAIGTVGLSSGITAVTAPPLVLWTEIAGMFLGRLEFLIVFIGLARIIRDIPMMYGGIRLSRGLT